MKRVLILSLTVLMLFAFSACSNQRTNSLCVIGKVVRLADDKITVEASPMGKRLCFSVGKVRRKDVKKGDKVKIVLDKGSAKNSFLMNVKSWSIIKSA